ncbi:MAG: tetratricopeptide repeat protein [Acetobacteraceae bacterium]
MKDRLIRRMALLALCLLSACAAGNAPGFAAAVDPSPAALGRAYGDFLIGGFAAGQMDFRRAARALEAALAVTPQDATLRREAFLAALDAGLPGATRLARTLPHEEIAQLLLADEEVAAGRFGLAVQRFAAMPDGGIAAMLKPILLGWAQAGAGQVDAALATLEPFVRGQRFRGIYALHAALIADLAGRKRQAGKFYHLAATSFGAGNLRLAQILASWQARSGRLAEARQTLAAIARQGHGIRLVLPALERNPAPLAIRNPADGIAEAYLALAASFHARHADLVALPLLQLALRLRPDLTAARLVLAEVVDTGNHPNRALAALAPVGAADPLAPLVDLRRALLLQAAGRPAEAVALLKTLAAAQPSAPEPEVTLGDVLRQSKHFHAAAAAYGAALARTPAGAPDRWLLHYYRGIAYDLGGDWTRAEADFKTALKLSPDQPYVLNYLGYSWAVKGRHLGRATAMIARAMKAVPNDGAVVDSMGYVLLRRGDRAGALHFLERAVHLMPGDATINGHLGDAYWASGEHLQAIYQWRRALTLDPSAKERARLLGRLAHGLPASFIIAPSPPAPAQTAPTAPAPPAAPEKGPAKQSTP